MNKDVNISKLVSSVDYQWLVPVKEGQLNKTIRKTNIKSDE